MWGCAEERAEGREKQRGETVDEEARDLRTRRRERRERNESSATYNIWRRE